MMVGVADDVGAGLVEPENDQVLFRLGKGNGWRNCRMKSRTSERLVRLANSLDFSRFPIKTKTENGEVVAVHALLDGLVRRD